MTSRSFLLWAQANRGGSICFILPFMAFWTCVMICWFKYYYYTVPELLERWAAENGLRIIKKERRDFFKGPFFWTSNNNQSVYRLDVEDAKGRPKSGWARVGSYWLPFGKKVEIRWDPPPPSSVPDDPSPGHGKSPMWDRDLDS